MHKELSMIVSEKTIIKKDENMASHTSFKIGGSADYFIVVYSKQDLMQVIKYAKEKKVPVFVMGNGSNLLVSDNGIRGFVIKLGEGFQEIKFDGEYVTAGSAISLNALAQSILEEELTGFEWAFGIPGTVGGAVFMNAGAYGGNMSDIVEETIYLDENYNICVLKKDAHEFGYRKSVFKEKKINGIILETKFKLAKGKKEEILGNMKKYIGARIDKQPLNMPSAGSVFKRPDGYFAGKLIEDAGLKGYKVGGASVSTKHSGFIVNNGNATAKDVKELISYIKAKVKEKYDVEMETEILEVGE